ncbi:MAG TPA: aminotransferase class III-fold pyridoxal phosphate-dependent enzyme [Bacillota bacterium]|nr:aminotransferase class III-fold pyridoxal phosphate-dependent enzyme [Bacillota bacterium]
MTEQALEYNSSGDTIIRHYENHINPGLTRLMRFMGLGTVEEHSQGCYVCDNEGHTFLDCLGGYGVFNLGHCHPEVVKAVKSQLDVMPMGSKVLFSAPQALLAAKLAEISPGNLQYSFFCNSGAEGVEGALKLARLATGRSKIIATQNAFHGKTLGALSATGRPVFREPCQPLLPDFYHVPYGDGGAAASLCDADTAAIIVEPVQGEGGIIIPPPGYLRELRNICDRNGALLIVDEVQTGMGRTGKMFACEHEGIRPDIMVLAKALGGGVMPIGAILGTKEVWRAFEDNPFIHTSTFGGNPLACTAALAAIKVLEDDLLVDGAGVRGDYLLQGLRHLQDRYPGIISCVRGVGLMIGLEMTDEGWGGFLMAELFQQGILVAYALNNPKVIRLEPPLVITKEQIDHLITAMNKAVEKAAKAAE